MVHAMSYRLSLFQFVAQNVTLMTQLKVNTLTN